MTGRFTRICLLGLLGLFVAAGFNVAPAQAQATRTWVSGVGDDANPCSRTAPCKTFAGSISKTAAGGEINCLDPGGFGALTITKAIAIICESGEAGVLVSGTNGFNVSAGPNDVVFLKGLDFEGIGSGLVGIQFNTGAALHVDDCVIRGFQAGTAVGINFTPSGANSRLIVRNSYISENGVGATTGGGIFIKPTGAGSALAVIDHTTVANNITGIRADGTGPNGGVKLSVTNSNSSGNAAGGIVSFTPAGGPLVFVMVDSSVVSNNLGNGLNANGGTLDVSRSVISGNATSVASSNGGTLQSYTDNDILGNTTNTLPTTMTHQ
jgi:hypothetical protein